MRVGDGPGFRDYTTKSIQLFSNAHMYTHNMYKLLLAQKQINFYTDERII